MPIVRSGDPLVDLVVDSVLLASSSGGFNIRDRDVVGVTESLLARAQGNYASLDAIASDVRSKFESDTLGVVFPILSRNRYALILKAIARCFRRVVVQLSYPADEVGNQLVDPLQLDALGISPWTENLTETRFLRELGGYRHPFTSLDYVAYYRSVVESEGASCEFLFSNEPQAILDHVSKVLACDIHTRQRTVQRLRAAGVQTVYSLADILNAPVDGSGYHPEYGLLGSNKAGDEQVKLFPRDGQSMVDDIQRLFKKRTGKTVEVLLYGDGAFKDPVGKIWELADPVVSPAFTSGLEGTPSEIKIKYLADNHFAGLKGEELRAAITRSIREKRKRAADAGESQGTTPRRLTDLIGSLCDLVSGSGDKGTPVVHVQGYFDNFASERCSE